MYLLKIIFILLLKLQENDLVCQYEMEGPGLPPLHSPLTTKILTATGSSSSTTTTSDQAPTMPFSAVHLHPQLIGVKQKEVALSKAHLVLRMIENRIGQDPLLQVFYDQS